jgi:UDP-glucuronate 4-epimerase
MKILVTGSAGFIGSALTLRLLESGYNVVGIDNHNDYYDPKLKDSRLKRHIDHKNYNHIKTSISNRESLEKIFIKYKPEIVINLAAQAGVRYSIKNPFSYVDSNLIGFSYILEFCRQYQVGHLVYASSSSVYGANTSLPFSEHDSVNHPLSLYAATKKANELMAHSYSHLYKLPATGLRFFTVYGPWDRPDMALQNFAHKINNNEAIEIFNYGNHVRDFTYIDDVIEVILKVIKKPPMPNQNWSSKKTDPGSSRAPWCIYNVGNNNPVNLMEYINELEKQFGKPAKKIFLPIQPGDVSDTWANVDKLIENFDYSPTTTIKEGISNFVSWFKKYYY